MLNKCYIYVKIKPENSMIKAEDVPLEFAYFFCHGNGALNEHGSVRRSGRSDC